MRGYATGKNEDTYSAMRGLMWGKNKESADGMVGTGWGIYTMYNYIY